MTSINGRKTNTEVYDAIDRLRHEINDRFNRHEDFINDSLREMKHEIDKNTEHRNQLTGKIAVISTAVVLVIGTAINWLWDNFSR